MENRKEKTKNLVRGISFGAVVVLLMVMVVGCAGKKSSKNNTNPYGYGAYGYGGAGYGGYGSVTNVAAGIESTGSAMVILSFATQGPQSGYTGGYQAPAMVSGEVDIYQPFPCGGAMLPRGQYQLIPNGPTAYYDGTMAGGIFFTVNGPQGQLQARIDTTVVFPTQLCGFQGMIGAIHFDLGPMGGCSMSFSDYDSFGMCR